MAQPPCISRPAHHARHGETAEARSAPRSSPPAGPASRSAAAAAQVGEVDAGTVMSTRPANGCTCREGRSASGRSRAARRLPEKTTTSGVRTAFTPRSLRLAAHDDVRQHQHGGRRAPIISAKAGTSSNAAARPEGGRHAAGAEAHQRQHDAGQQQHQHRARQSARASIQPRCGIPVAVGVERPAAGRSRRRRCGPPGRSSGSADPGQQRQQGLAEPDIGDDVGKADRRRRGADARRRRRRP